MLGASVLLGLVLTAAAAPAYCTGQPTSSESGVPLYPNGQRVVDGFGKEYHPNGARVTNDYGDEIVFYQVDIVAGAIDLRQVRYEFSSGSAVITLAADLVSGRLDRPSIGAVCGSGGSSR
jgi:hypothetical protein